MSIINKKKLNELLSLSNDPKIELLEDNQKSYKIEINGDKEKVKFKDNGFSEKQLEQLGQLMDHKLTYALIPIIQRLDNIEIDMKDVKSRLDVLESLPTIQKELKSKNKK